MAFLCPYGIKKKDKRDGRQPRDAYAAGDDGVDDEDHMTHKATTFLEVVQDYYPCSALELPVKAGEIVNFIENEGSWVFVRAENGSDGYIPRRHCRIVDKNDGISDVGYYSDHQRNDNDIRFYKDTNQRARFQETKKRSVSQSLQYNAMYRKYSDHNEPTSSSASPASTVSSNYIQPSASPRKWTETKGLFSQHLNVKNNYISEVSPRVQRYSEAQEPLPICGRKCQQGCSHGAPHKSAHGAPHRSALNETQKEVRFGANTSPAFIAISSKVDGDINNSLSAEKLRKRSEQLVTETEMSLLEHNQLRMNLHNYWHDAKTTKIQQIQNNGKKQRSQSAPAANLVFSKCGHPELIVIKDYQKQGETDITVDRGDYAAIINDTKYDQWMFILNEKGDRGFIPTECVIKHQCDKYCKGLSHSASKTIKPRRSLTVSAFGKESLVDSYDGDPTKYIIPDTQNMTRMVVTKNYSGQDLDDLYTCIGDFVFLGERRQSLEGWLWVYSPRQKCSGYIPTNVVELATETSLATV